MKAIVYKRYGHPDVLQLQEVEKPVPKENEILIKVISTTVTAADWRMRKADPFLARLFNGLFSPKKVNILGLELSGQIEAVGKEVKQYKKGDAVFAFTGFGFGGYADYRCMEVPLTPEQAKHWKLAKKGLVALKPFNLSFQEAACIPVGALTALGFLRAANLQPGQNILIYGASGSVGTFAVQLARHFFNAEVTGVCSTTNVELVRSLGATKVIDYTKQNFAETGETYEVIFDAVQKISRKRGKKVLTKNGKFLSVHGSPATRREDLDLLKQLVEKGMLKPVIDRQFPPEQVQEAHRYVENGHKKGNVVINFGERGTSVNEPQPDKDPRKSISVNYLF